MSSTTNHAAAYSFGVRCSMTAAEDPSRVALTFVGGSHEDVWTWRRLDQHSSQLARFLLDNGVSAGSLVVIGLPNSPDHIALTIAAWKIGACVLPLSGRMPGPERKAVLEVAKPSAVIAEWDGPGFAVVRPSDLPSAARFSTDPLPDPGAWPAKAIGSGGSTGTPKIILDPNPWVRAPGDGGGLLGRAIGLKPNWVQLVSGPLYHTAPFSWCHWGLFDKHHVVLCDRFDARRWIDLVERYRVQFAFLVPTMMHRIASQEGVEVESLSSIELLFHSGGSCAPWLKRRWIDFVGPTHLVEGYGSTEGMGLTVVRGDEWLRHIPTVGRAYQTEIQILDDSLCKLPAGQIGEIFMRPHDYDAPTFRYIGAPAPKVAPDGLVSVGDLGWLDDEGYLYIADRRLDMIVSGGANIFPAEVEAVITAHPGVADAVVVGVRDDEWGRRVHAIVEPKNWLACPSPAELQAFCRERLTPYKVPKSFELVEHLPRDESGKIRRSMLAAERSALN